MARAIDTQQPQLVDVLKRAHGHRGASFVEILQNCVVYNDGVFDAFTEKSVAPDRQVHVRHGQPLVFGADQRRGLRLDPKRLALQVVTPGENGVTAADLLVHDETNRTLAGMLAALEPPDFPVALGVLYCDPAPTYEQGDGRSWWARTSDGVDRLVRMQGADNVCPSIGAIVEDDLLIMGRAARPYLDEQRAKAPPALRRAIDRIWQRIVDEGR